MKKIFFTLIFFPLFTFSQNIEYAKKIIDTLCNDVMKGRFYSFNGDKRAALFIANELDEMKIEHFEENYFQLFNISANTFESDMYVKIGNKNLVPGKDFIVTGCSKSVEGKYKIITLNKEIYNDTDKFINFKSQNFSKSFLFFDTLGTKIRKDEFNDITYFNEFGAAGIILVSDKLTFVPSSFLCENTVVIINKNSLPNKLKKIKISIKSNFKSEYETQNVIGYIKGEVDTFIVLSAHYDHIGTLGKTVFFAGANDNASGCAMLLDLAKEYKQRKGKPYYSIVFMFFSAEELGILGSKYYTKNPLFQLEKIKFLINLDMVGTGDKGIQIVNSTIFTKEYKKMLDINEKYNLLPEIKKRGAAANSDHYFFYEAGVPSFFIYSLGDYKEYHNINDNEKNIPLSKYNEIFKLIMFFVDEMY